jgi:arginyl-tRNA synthetase
MVEYAQPNTHHSFHIGHSRNALLGESLARIVQYAGFETIRASYPGDIGLGVITVVWAYRKLYLGQEPAGVHERGQWLLKIYVEQPAWNPRKTSPQRKKHSGRRTMPDNGCYAAGRRRSGGGKHGGSPVVEPG